ncbi:MAG TPA: hypothetical protein VH912_13450, partial [Streptosporangiaceae bacterium]
MPQSVRRSRALVAAVGLICGVLVALHAPASFASMSPNWATGIKAVLPSDAATNANATLESVACPSAGNCTVAGYYTDSSAHHQGVLFTQSSGAWSAGMKAPLPGDAGTNPNVFVRSLSCPTVGNCVAVGSYQDNMGRTQGLLLIESGGSWTAETALLPGDAGTNPMVSLSQVSCPSVDNCAVVGSYKDTSNNTQGLLLDEQSGAWGAAKLTPPSNAATPDPQVNVTTVSCGSAGNCAAGGQYRDNLTQGQALLATESSGTWGTAVQTPLPADGTTQGGTGLFAVSCPPVGGCAAVGSYYDTGTHTHGLLLNESSGTWTARQAALPADAGTTDPAAALYGVSCPAAGECGAAGTYTDASGHTQGVLLNESAGTWTAGIRAALPPDAGADPNVDIEGVSCVSPGTCSAAGSYQDAAGHYQGMFPSEFAGAWAPAIKVSVPADAGPDPGVELGIVSCATAGSCAAATLYQDGGAHYQGLLLGAIPANPTLTFTAPAKGTVGRALAAPNLGAVLAGGASPVGAINVTVFGPQASAPGVCTSGGKPVGSASVSGNATYHPAAGFTPTRAGRYWWFASYGGDTGDNPAASACGASMRATVVTALPKITRLTQSDRRWRRGKKRTRIASSTAAPIGTTFGFTVNQRVRVRFAFSKRVKGRKVGRKCVANRSKGRRCTRKVKAGAFVLSARAGRRKVRFQGRISARKRLRPGRYTLTVTATDSQGRKSAPRSLKFTI